MSLSSVLPFESLVSSGRLSLSQLESHLWASANILRGPVDAADFKTYIFPLLFFKRICDVYDEELEKALIESGGDHDYAAFDEFHRFKIPVDCHYREVHSKTQNVGAALHTALNKIERANQDTLYGIFGDAAWTNKERLSDALLRNLLDHFGRLNLSNASVEPDVLGQAYEYLIKKFADATNKKAGEFYTPRSVVALMVAILSPNGGETIYDPACGTGGMLLEALAYVKSHYGHDKGLWGRLYGQEKNLTTSAIARMNLLLHGLEDFQIVRGDTLRTPAFVTGDRLATFDCVVANPPFSLEKWGDELWAHDPYGRNKFGLPPKTSGDFAWVQHMIASMDKARGRMAVVLPHGALFRGGVEGTIRRRLIEADLLDAVIGLGSNLFYGTGLAACLLIFRARKSSERKRKVTVIDASHLFKRGRSQNTLETDHIQTILEWLQGNQNVPGVVKIVTLSEIEREGFNLNIARYIENVTLSETPPLSEALITLREALNEAVAAETNLEVLLNESGLIAPI